VGRLTDNPEVRYTVDGTPITKFRLAVDRDHRKDETHQVDFINIIAWRRLAEVCGEFLKKGRLVLVEGRIQVRSYDNQSGQRRWVTEVVARDMHMLEKAPQQPEAAPSPQPPEEEIPLPEFGLEPAEEDLPF
jgi:single-strand DNA-binding protein